MLYIGSKLFVVDNSGVKSARCIRVPYKHIPAKLGSIILISVLVRQPLKRKIRVGQLHRAVVVSRGFPTFRFTGHCVSSLNAIVVLKKNDNVPLSKRIKGPVCYELRQRKMVKLLTMGSFAF